MCRCRPSTPKFGRNAAGFSVVELLVATGLLFIIIAGTGSMFLASNNQMRNQALEIETTQAARAAADILVRDLRLGGACLPVTGSFIALEGVEAATRDEIVTRTGVTRADLSCIRTATAENIPAAGSTVKVTSAQGFEPDMRAYLRHPNGTGEYFTVTSVDIAGNALGRSTTFSVDYPATSGVYSIDERHYSIEEVTTADGIVPQLMLAIDGGTPHPFARGIQEFNIRYELNRGCPAACDVVDLPASPAEWQLVERILLTLRAQSVRPNRDGTYYQRTLRVSAKPRNLLPR